ncbi:hypothetical protein CR105_23070 [Massilia eurypsychrophila]|uniref:Uncharacterized protein n=1 Tax=Massilia eurypsychrophila TaxID=1485217 RepID=A0A2G8T979_9BURK|nr:hypothetical protein CR105_23070 [Massilia eurypsychrophila]
MHQAAVDRKRNVQPRRTTLNRLFVTFYASVVTAAANQGAARSRARDDFSAGSAPAGRVPRRTCEE